MVYFLLHHSIMYYNVSRLQMGKKGENAQTAKNTLTAVEPVPWVSSDAADKVHVIGKQTHNNVY